MKEFFRKSYYAQFASLIFVLLTMLSLESCNKDEEPTAVFSYRLEIIREGISSEQEETEYKLLEDTYSKQLGGIEVAFRGTEENCDNHVADLCNNALQLLAGKGIKNPFIVTVVNITTDKTVYEREYPL